MNQNPWVEMRDGRAPRLWLSLPEGNLLISWETMKKIRATSDFLNIVFECEYGIITFFLQSRCENYMSFCKWKWFAK